MPFCHRPIIPWPGAAESCFIPAEDPGGWILAEAPAAYRPRHPERTGATWLALDPLEWIHRITAHIPDPGRHGQRFYGAYSNRARVTISSADGDSARAAANTHPEQDHADFSWEARSTWARLLRKIFEVDPLICACGGRMQMVSFITEPRVIDRILRHRESERCNAKDPFESRAPPGAHTRCRQ